MLQWFQRLMPRQDAFFPAFERHAAVMVKAAVALREMVAGGDQLKPRFQDIIDLEHEADGVAREVLLGLRTTFITPFDRADIQSLITSMDDSVDQCKATAKAIMLFESGLHVAQTVGTGIISPDIVDGQVIFGALMGAIVWNLLTWWGAIPSSSSHALIGGLIGAGTAKAGFSAVVWWGTLKTVAAIVWAPLLGFALALLLWLVVAWLLMRSTPYTVDQKFRVLQLGSAAL
jgi:hypothetical protein